LSRVIGSFTDKVEVFFCWTVEFLKFVCRK